MIVSVLSSFKKPGIQGMFNMRNLRSVKESAQTDQSHHCTYEDSLGIKKPTDYTAKTQNRLGGCPG